MTDRNHPYLDRIEALIAKVRAANQEASNLGELLASYAPGEEHDHMMQAHFRLTEAAARVRVVLRAALSENR